MTDSGIRPISHQSTNDKVVSLVVRDLGPATRVADVGAGEGYFSSRIGQYVEQNLACQAAEVIYPSDVFPELFRYSAVQCAPIEGDGRLPYEDASIDIACSLEVIEHVEDQFLFTRELFRILRPGGRAIISTPNVLNANSRWRNLHSGFATLFDPLLLSSTDPVHTSGHINPVSYYYLAYQLRRAGFASTHVTYDRFKTSGRLLLALLSPFIYPANWLFRQKLQSRKEAVARENAGILDDLWSSSMLTARSIIVIADKPASSPDSIQSRP